MTVSGGESAEGVEGRPEHRVVERPVADRPGDHARVARAQDLSASPVPSISARRAAATPRRRRDASGPGRGPGRGGESRPPRRSPASRAPPGSAVSQSDRSGPSAERHRRPEHRDGDEVDAALDQEEGDRAAGDPRRRPCRPGAGSRRRARGRRRRSPGTSEPIASSEPPICQLRRQPSPVQKIGPNMTHVGGEGKALEHGREREPAGVGAGEQVAHLAEARGEQDDRHQDAERGDRLQRPPPQGAGLKLARQLLRRGRRNRDVERRPDALQHRGWILSPRERRAARVQRGRPGVGRGRRRQAPPRGSSSATTRAPSWFGGGPSAYVVHPEAKQAEIVSIFRVTPRDE